jgi:hypothetical protein
VVAISKATVSHSLPEGGPAVRGGTKRILVAGAFYYCGVYKAVH